MPQPEKKPEITVFLEKSVDFYLADASERKLQYDKKDCLECYSYISDLLRDAIERRLLRTQIPIDYHVRSIEIESCL